MVEKIFSKEKEQFPFSKEHKEHSEKKNGWMNLSIPPGCCWLGSGRARREQKFQNFLAFFPICTRIKHIYVKVKYQKLGDMERCQD